MPTRTNSLALTMACQLLHSARRPNGAPIHLPKRPLAAKRIHRGFGTGQQFPLGPNLPIRPMSEGP
ncbi:hypothetical protein, partial [Candidatus Entotheonella palauensis]|uniref:hypothetical protein n=1 Tax=Candidatus Entotheonella palauensis TaxID=93172 RepID=UPI001C4E1BF9